jgi:hypothetical protein
MMEISFQIDQNAGGRYTAKAIGSPIVVEAADVESIAAEICGAVREHFADEAERPRLVHFYFLCNGAFASSCSLPL